MKKINLRDQGILAASGSAVFLGLTPIFGKQSILLGFTPLAVVAIRTTIACLLLLAFLLVFKRSYFYIYPLGLAGCLAAGLINGVGSIFYYTAISRIDAGIGQLLYSFYPLFMVFWLILDRQSVNRVTLLRLMFVFPGAFLLLQTTNGKIDLIGAAFMILAAVFYALHLLVNQRILYEVPAPTVTFYTLVSMSITVIIAFLIFNPTLPVNNVSWTPLLLLSLITFISRLTLFLGVKHLGGIQTALLGLGELLVTVVVAQIWLSERLSPVQWIGAILICLNLALVIFDKPNVRKRYGRGFLFWLNPPSVKPGDAPFHN